MWILLRSVRQFVMGSAGMGSVLLGWPAVFADCPDCQYQTSSSPAAYSLTPQPMAMMDSGYSYQSVPSYPAPVQSDSSQWPQYQPTPVQSGPSISTWDQSPQYQPTPVPISPSPQPTISPWDQPPPIPASPAPARVAKPGWVVVPPPGTLGKTYQRQSWPIPKDEHPRTAIIQVSAPGFTQMQVDGLADMEGFQRPDGAWIFKSKQPLTPGVPHIYHVKAGYKNSENNTWDVRTVRLIPGRVVTLEY